jgi:hypothetical protein
MRKRVIIGVLLTLGAFAQAGLSWHLTRVSADNERLTATAWKKADVLCKQAVEQIATVQEVGGAYVANRSLTPDEDWRVALMDASSVISNCSTRRMTSFCMGRACGEITDRATTLSNLEDQLVAPSASDILRTEPVKISFRLQEVR